jgi:hypothetical protein
MRGEDSYAALGLKPGAGRAEEDEAYRRLIKRYHPDRTGGDGSRAAVINRAYGQIRRGGLQVARPRTVPVVIHPPRARSSRRVSWVFAALLLAVGAAAFTSEDVRRSAGLNSHRSPARWQPPPVEERGSSAYSAPLADFDEPLQAEVVDRAIASAAAFHAERDVDGAAAFSRDCSDKIRERPTLTWFDTCAAFDEAMLTLSDDDPGLESSPFSNLAVMGRELAAARALSNDAVGADSRVHQIRVRVEMALLPRFDQPVPAKPQPPAPPAG